jgi:hypothetical protein
MMMINWGNHRIVQWKIGKDQGNQLSSPTDVILDKQTNCLFIRDRGNRRVKTKQIKEKYLLRILLVGE